MADRQSVTDTRTVAVTVRYFAAARAAAGVPEETVPVPTVTGPGTAPLTSVGVVVATAGERRPDLGRVLLRCSYLLDEVAVHGPDTPVRAGQVLDVLPPFAGG